MNVLLVGPPGSGKGTQGTALADRLLLPHIATGDLLRAEVRAGTDLGRRVGGLLDRGELVPDDVMLDLVMPVVARAAGSGGYLLDGFPRTLAQARAVQGWRPASGDGPAIGDGPAGDPEPGAGPAGGDADVGPDAVIVLEVPDEVLVRRILARGRRDDTEPVVRRRLEVYREETEPLVGLYRDRGIVHVVDGAMEADAVSDAVLAELDVPRV